MNSLNIKTFGLLAVGSIAFTSCINSQEAYEKAALSGFVASQTKDIVEKNKVDLTPVQKEIKSVDMKVEALDADNKKIAATVSETQSHNIRLKPDQRIEIQCSRSLAKGESVTASNGVTVVGRGQKYGMINNTTGEEVNLSVTKSVTTTPVSVTYS